MSDEEPIPASPVSETQETAAPVVSGSAPLGETGQLGETTPAMDSETRSSSDPIRDEINALLPKSKGQLGLVATCLADGIIDRKEIVDSAGRPVGPLSIHFAGVDGQRMDKIPCYAAST